MKDLPDRIFPFGTEWISSLDLITILLLIILIFFLGSVFFFFLTLFLRIQKIREEKQKKLFQEEIDPILFGILFDEGKSENLGSNFTLAGKSNLYQKVMIKSLIGLHQNFSGASTQKLEEFFVHSGLVNYSLKKLRFKSWVRVVEGIRDLSSLNYQAAYDQILSVKFEQNDMVQQEKLIARIRLRGLKELWAFRDSSFYFNDWTQSNIIFAIKRFKVPSVDHLPELLHAKNESVALLGIRLIHYYHEIKQLEVLEYFKGKTPRKRLIYEIDFLLHKKRFSRI